MKVFESLLVKKLPSLNFGIANLMLDYDNSKPHCHPSAITKLYKLGTCGSVRLLCPRDAGNTLLGVVLLTLETVLLLSNCLISGSGDNVLPPSLPNPEDSADFTSCLLNKLYTDNRTLEVLRMDGSVSE